MNKYCLSFALGFTSTALYFNHDTILYNIVRKCGHYNIKLSDKVKDNLIPKDIAEIMVRSCCRSFHTSLFSNKIWFDEEKLFDEYKNMRQYLTKEDKNYLKEIMICSFEHYSYKGKYLIDQMNDE